MSSAAELRSLIRKAHEGDTEALGELLAVHRPYLRMMARRYVGQRLRVRLDESDLVQQTCLSAFRNFGKFKGEEGTSFLHWLKKIHERNIQDVIRDHVETEKRTVDREDRPGNGVPLNVAVTSSVLSPSRRLMQDEGAVQLAAALDQLPETQREAVRLRYLEGWPLEEISQHLNRTDQAVAGLLKRGMRALRRHLLDTDSETNRGHP